MTLIACWDLETTGNQVEKDRIIELAISVRELETWTEKFRYSRRFNPGMKVASKALAVHGIADADLVGCPSFGVFVPMMVGLMQKVDLWVGHNIVGFDFPVLTFEMARFGAAPKNNLQVLDTMLEGRWATPDGKQPTLGELCWAMDVPYDASQAHAALYDVSVNLEAVRRGIELGYFHVQPALAMAA